MKIVEDYKFNKDLFAEVSPTLLATAVRVYRANQRQGNQATKTRSAVIGTNKKMYKQKGTGHARHSDSKAPIFVGGGVAHGPHPRDFSLKMPQKARQLAVKGALYLKNKDKKIEAISGLEKLTGKTKELAEFLDNVKVKGTLANPLIVTNGVMKKVHLAARNIPGVRVLPATDLNTYEVMRASMILWDEGIGNEKEKVKEEKPEIKEVKNVKAEKTVKEVKRSTVKPVTKKVVKKKV